MQQINYEHFSKFSAICDKYWQVFQPRRYYDQHQALQNWETLQILWVRDQLGQNWGTQNGCGSWPKVYIYFSSTTIWCLYTNCQDFQNLATLRTKFVGLMTALCRDHGHTNPGAFYGRDWVGFAAKKHVSSLFPSSMNPSRRRRRACGLDLDWLVVRCNFIMVRVPIPFLSNPRNNYCGGVALERVDFSGILTPSSPFQGKHMYEQTWRSFWGHIPPARPLSCLAFASHIASHFISLYYYSSERIFPLIFIM